MDSQVHLCTLLGALLLSTHTLYTLCKAYGKHSRLSRVVSSPRDTTPFLLRILVKHQLSRSLALSSLLLELVNLLVGASVIRNQQQYTYHSVLSKGEHTPYYDFNFGLQFYQTAFLATATSISLVFSLRGKITRVFSQKLLVSLSLVSMKGMLDSYRYLHYTATREYQVLQITCDLALLLLLAYLLLLSSRLKSLQQHIDLLNEFKRKEVYQDQMSRLQSQEEEQILSYSSRMNKALDSYHQLKNIRKHSWQLFSQGRSFTGLFLAMLCVVFLTSNFSQLRSLDAQSAPVCSPFWLKRLEDSQGTETREYLREESNQEKQNVILYILSGVNYEEFQQHVMPGIQTGIPNPEDTRLHSLDSVAGASSIGSWISLLSGTRPELHGVYGDSATLEITRLDSLFRSLDSDDQMDHMVYGNDFFEDVMQQLYHNVRLSRYFKEMPRQRGILRESTFKYKSKTQKIGRYIQLYEQQDANHTTLQHQAQKKVRQLKEQHVRLQAKTEKLTEQDEQEYVQIVDSLMATMGNTQVKSLINKSYFFLAQDDDLYSSNGRLTMESLSRLSTKAEEIVAIIKDLKNETTLVITSDCHKPHDLPLFIYRKGSHSPSSPSPPGSYSLIDVAPTLAVLMGQPIPRLNQGRFLNDSLVLAPQESQHYLQELFMQQRRLVSQFLDKFELAEEEFSRIRSLTYEQLRQQDSLSYSQQIDYMLALLQESIETVQAAQIQANLQLNSLLVLLAQMFIVVMVQKSTSVDLVSLFSHQDSPSRSLNRLCLSHALGIYLLVIAMCASDCIGFYLAVLGHSQFDVSVVSSALELNYFLFFALVKPILLNIMIQMYLFYHYAIWSCQTASPPLTPFHSRHPGIDPKDDSKTASKYLTWWRIPFLNKNELEYEQYAMAKIYLTRFYLALLCAFLGGLGVILQSCSTLLLPPALAQTRFVLMYFLFLNSCTLAIGIYSLYLWPQFSLTKSCMDSVYLLAQYKMHKSHQMPSHIICFLQSAFCRVHTNVESVQIQKAYGIPGESNEESYRKSLLEVFFKSVKEEEMDVNLRDKANQFSDEYQVVDESLLNIIFRKKAEQKE